MLSSASQFLIHAERFHFHFSCLIFFYTKPALNSFEPSRRLIPENFAERRPMRVLSWKVTTSLCSAENECARAALHKHSDPQWPLHLPTHMTCVWLMFSHSSCGWNPWKADWRLLTGLFTHNNWDSQTDCRENVPRRSKFLKKKEEKKELSTDPVIFKAISHPRSLFFYSFFVICVHVLWGHFHRALIKLSINLLPSKIFPFLS